MTDDRTEARLLARDAELEGKLAEADAIREQFATSPHIAGIEFLCGKWEDELCAFGVPLHVVDALITDPPYGERTHKGSRSNDPRGNGHRYDGASSTGLGPGVAVGEGGDQRGSGYEWWTPADVDRFVSTWSPYVRGWFCAQTSHDLIPAWEAAFARVDRLCFTPIPCVISGMSVRLRGDGPSSESVSLMVARPRTREFSSWGTLPGYYYGPSVNHAGGGRGKPPWLMRAIVDHYSRRGDLICDPLAGWASTLTAARDTGRRAIGCDMDPEAHAEGLARISQGVARRRAEQIDMFGGGNA